jgi:hypothetical protein
MKLQSVTKKQTRVNRNTKPKTEAAAWRGENKEPEPTKTNQNKTNMSPVGGKKHHHRESHDCARCLLLHTFYISY